MNQLRIPAIVCILFVLNSCRKDVAPDPKSLSVDRETSALQGGAGLRDTIHITSNDQWVVALESGVDWLSVEPMSGTGNGMIIISTTQQNNTPSRKTTNVEVKTTDGAISRHVTVIQLQFNTIILNAIFGGEGSDSFRDLTTTPGGGYIAVGASGSTGGDGAGARGGLDVWIVRFNSEGEKMWHKKYGGTLEDVAHSIIRTSSNNYLVLGSTLSNDGDVSASKGGRDAWLLNIDGDGNLLWEKTIGGTGEDELYNLKSSADGNYIMSGWTFSTDGDVSFNHGNADAWIVKVNDQGDIVFEKTYGGSNQDVAFDATPVSDGGYIFCGRVSSADGDAADRTSEASAGWFAKLNSAGTLAGKVYIGESTVDAGVVAMESLNGDFLFAGTTASDVAYENFHGDYDAFVLRVGAAGNIRWAKAFGGSGRERLADFIETNDGNFILAGSTKSDDGDITSLLGGEDVMLLKLNGDGNIITSTTFGGSSNDHLFKIKQIGNNEFAFAGQTSSFVDAHTDLPDGPHGWFQIIGF
jgi:hypothetical protein